MWKKNCKKFSKIEYENFLKIELKLSKKTNNSSKFAFTEII